MKSTSKYTHSLPLCLIITFFALLTACSDEIEAPGVYSGPQIRRLLMGEGEGATKTWQQRTQYYLDDTCRTGFLLEFRQGAGSGADAPFEAVFHRDTLGCELADTALIIYVLREVTTPKDPQHPTTDSLVFADTLGNRSVRLIRVLTTKQLQMDLVNERGVLHREEYWLQEPLELEPVEGGDE